MHVLKEVFILVEILVKQARGVVRATSDSTKDQFWSDCLNVATTLTWQLDRGKYLVQVLHHTHTVTCSKNN